MGTHLSHTQPFSDQAESKLQAALGLKARVCTHLELHMPKHWPFAGAINDLPCCGQSALPGDSDGVARLTNELTSVDASGSDFSCGVAFFAFLVDFFPPPGC